MTRGRIVLFGATGYTGRLTAAALVAAGLAPVLAGRDRERLVALTEELAVQVPPAAKPSWQVASADDPASVRALIDDPADILISTVGPFARLGYAALDAAIDVGAGYLDCTGEHTFVQHVFTQAHERAIRSGARLLTAFGYDYVPGNLAGAIALHAARDRDPARLAIGYFVRGSFGLSSGTRASAIGMALKPSFAFREARIIPERSAKRLVRFDVDGRSRPGLTIGGSEHFTMPRLAPQLRQVEVALGWPGRLTPAVQAGSALIAGVGRLPGIDHLIKRPAKTGTGPSAKDRARATSLVVADVFDLVGRPIEQVVVTGPSPYDLTAQTLTWGARMLAEGRTSEVGALGPADAFGLDAFVAGCRSVGLVERR